MFAILVEGPWAHPASETIRASSKMQPGGQSKGLSVLADSRQRWTDSPLGVLLAR